MSKSTETICKNCRLWNPVRGCKTADGTGQRAGKCSASEDGFRWFGENRKCDQKDGEQLHFVPKKARSVKGAR